MVTVSINEIRAFFLFILLLAGKTAKGQNHIIPAFFDTFEKSLPLYNPAIPADTGLTLSGGHQFNTGPFSTITSSFFHGAFRRGSGTLSTYAVKEQRGELSTEQGSMADMLIRWP